jgi:hypothetical protein
LLDVPKIELRRSPGAKVSLPTGAPLTVPCGRVVFPKYVTYKSPHFFQTADTYKRHSMVVS